MEFGLSRNGEAGSRERERGMIPEGMKKSPEAPGGIYDLDPSRPLCCVNNDFHRHSTSVHLGQLIALLGHQDKPY